nr:helix-turn-helix domain-containing protein [uncultured Oscillibacter sp.]
MGRELRYLGPSERAEIERLHNGGAPVAKIAEKVGSHVATIYRKLPNGYTGAVDEYSRWVYSAEIAQRVFERNIKCRGERVAAAEALREEAVQKWPKLGGIA